MKIRPTWTKTLGNMIDDYLPVAVSCSVCSKSRTLSRDDLAALAEKVGRDYSLWNRRCRCRLTPGCRGWNKFHYRGHGCMRLMMDGFRLHEI